MNIRQIRKGGGGFLCRTIIVTNCFAVVECNGQEAVIFLNLTPGNIIIAGKSCPEFSDEQARAPEVGDEIIAYVEDIEGQYVVVDWGYYHELLMAETTIKQRGHANGTLPPHMAKRAQRRSPSTAPIATMAEAFPR